MDSSGTKVETFRANWVFVLLLILFGAAMLATAFGTFVLTCTIAFPLRDYDLSRGVRVVGWAFSALCTGLFGWALWMHAVGMAHYVARLDALGVDFRFGSKKDTRDYYFKWDEIAAVKHQKRVDSTYYVVAKDNFSVKFTIYSFCRPKKLAMRIAGRIGQTVEEYQS
jgi:hypothetical protein